MCFQVLIQFFRIFAMHIQPLSLISLAAVSLLALNACSTVGVATGAGAAVGVASVQEGGISRAVDDARIQIAINDLWFRYDVDTFRKLDLTISHGRVLITGIVQDPEDRVEAVRLAWQPEGVTQVLNEIRVAEGRGITGFARDTWISARIRGAITFDSEVQSVNYSIDTVKGIVYLIGGAQDQAELNRVIEIARTVPDVDQVVSYVKILGEPVLSEQAPLTPVDAPAYTAAAPAAAYSSPQDVAPAAGVTQNAPLSPQQRSNVEVIPLEPPSSASSGAQGGPTDLTPKDREIIIWNQNDAANNVQER